MKQLISLLIIVLACACTSSGPELPSADQPSWNADRIVSGIDKSNKKIADSSNRYQIRLERISKQVKGISSREVYIDTKIDLFVLGTNLRANSGLMDIMRDDELISLIVQELAHNKLGHYRNLLENVSDGYERALETTFSDTQNSSSDAYALNYFFENKLDPQAVVNSAYKLAKIEEKVILLGADISYSPRLINKSARDRARAIASMLQEAKQNPSYLAGLIQQEAPTTVPVKKQEIAAISKPEIEKPKSKLDTPVVEKKIKVEKVLPVESPEPKIEKFKEEKIPDPEEMVLSKTEDKKEVKKVLQGTKSASLGSFKKVAVKAVSQEAPSNILRVAKGWYLQISAENNKEAAVLKVQELSDSQLRGTIQEINVSGETFYRVLVGPYASKDELAEAKKSSLIRADAFARHVE